MKRVLTILLALALTLAMALPAAADSTYTITINNTAPGHTYEAYQIFAGDLEMKDGKTLLTNITWGRGVTAAGKAALGDAAAKAETLKTEADAQAFAKEVAPYLTSPAESTAGTGVYTISGLQAGYYLVKDKDNTLTDADDFYTAYLMEVVGNVTAAPKGDKPTLDKQIKHNERDTWEVVGDNQIGDTVEFRTITTVPDTAGYEKYDYIIHDTMSVGLTSNVKGTDDVTIKVNDTGDALDASYYTVNASGNTFAVKIDILKAIRDGKMSKGNELYTYYTGVLNADAKVYDEGKQDNEAYLEYSNNPNVTDDKGKTPKKKVYDWTFKMGVNKVNERNAPITGAKFVLSRKGTLTVSGLNCDDQGVPAVTADLIGLVAVQGGYRVAVQGDTNVVYVIEAGSPVIKGLDDAIDYYLYETKAPEGFNLLKEPVKFKITAQYNADGSALADGYPTVTIGAGEPSAALSTNVVNKAGAELPSTGGVGTTVFYVVGGLLVAVAVVLLVTKKKMSADK